MGKQDEYPVKVRCFQSKLLLCILAISSLIGSNSVLFLHVTLGNKSLIAMTECVLLFFLLLFSLIKLLTKLSLE